MGNSKSDVQFAINLDKQFYFSSETVTGHLFVNAKKRYSCARVVLEIIGVEECTFRLSEGATVGAKKLLINTRYVVAQFGYNQFMEGQYDFPFSFKFYQYLPGTFHETKLYKANVSYFIKAVIVPKDKKAELLQKSMEITIREPQKEGERMLQGETFANYRSCFCLDKGVSRIFCYFQKNYYFPGEECIMICEVDSTRCYMDISRIKCELIKEVTLTSQNGSQRTFTELLNTVYFPGVRAHASYFQENAQRQIIKLTEKDPQKGLHPSTHGHYVRCQYYILVKPLFGGLFGRVSDGEFKVYLTILQPAARYEPIEKPQDWQPQLHTKSNIILNFNPYESNEQLSSMNSGNGGSWQDFAYQKSFSEQKNRLNFPQREEPTYEKLNNEQRARSPRKIEGYS